MMFLTHGLFRLSILLLLFASINVAAEDSLYNSNTRYYDFDEEDAQLLITKSNDFYTYNIKERHSFAISALDIALQSEDSRLIIYAYDNLAGIKMLMGDYFDAEKLFYDADKLVNELKFPELSVLVKNKLGNLLRQRGIFYMSVEFHNAALEISERNAYIHGISSSLNHLGMVYKNLEQNDKAREYYDLALKLSLPNDFHEVTIRIFNNIGTLNLAENNPDMSFYFYDQALIMAQNIDDTHSKAILFNNIGNVYRNNKDFDTALAYYSKADSVLTKFYNIPLYSLVIRNIGLTYFEMKEFSKAKELLDESLVLTNEIGLKSMIINNYFDRARLQFEMKNYAEAYNDMMAFNQISKALNNKNLMGQASLLEARKDETSRIKDLYQSLKQRNTIIFFFAISFLLLVTGLLVIFYKRNRDKKSYISQLQNSLKEREIITSALKKSEEKYSKLIKTMNEGLIMSDENDIIQFSNNKACQMLNAGFDQIKYKSIKDFIFSQDDVKIYNESFELRKIGVSDQFEIQLKRLDGELFWGHFSVSPMLDENHKFYGTVIVLMDVTESKESNYQLQEATENLNQKIKQLNCLFDISDLTSVPGITFEDILKKSLDIIPNGLKYSHDVYVEIVFENGVYRSDNYKETPWTYHTPIKIYKKKLGFIKVGYLEEKPTVNKDPFQFSEKILIKSIAEKIAQVMEAKNMETALSESREKLYQAQKIAKIGNWEWDLQSGKKTFSDSYFEIMGIAPERRALFDDDAFKEIIHVDDRNEIISQMHKIYSGNYDEINSSYRITDHNGNIKHIRATGKINCDEKTRPIMLIGTVQDVTDQVVNQELKNNIEIAVKTSEIKQQFLANMSHEMRTPMNGILGMIDFLMKTNLSEEQFDYALTIKNSSESLLNIINDVLDLSKIEAGKLMLKPVDFSLFETLKKVKGLFSALTKQKVLDFNINIDKNVPEFIRADENRLLQVITNLISNAVKFTPEGSVELNIMLKNKDDKDLELFVEVSDTGIGISEEAMGFLFKPFSQIDTSLNRSHEGTGLGLSICRSIVKLMNGDIGVKNNIKGKGTTFYFSFNAVLLDKKILPSQSRIISDDTELNLNIDVLLVEDKIINQKIIKMMLENAGCRVKLAYNGQQALDIMESSKFDIIFLDIQMPVMDGVTANKHMRKRFDDLPPIIALSANALEGDAEKYINAGMDDYISKPVRSEDLYDKILSWLKTDITNNKI